MKNLQQTDETVFNLIQQEEELQRHSIRLIPSENYVSHAVREAVGSVLMNKYSEGYPGKRYYEGQQVIDQVETLAIERAQALFGMDHANVQPYSGSPANLEVYLGLLEPGDTIMGMALSHGGHLTHGFKVSATGRLFRSVQYTVDANSHLLDYDAIEAMAMRERPKLIVAGATAYPRVIDFERFGAIAKKVGAFLLADIAHISGLVVAREHPSPAGYADVVTTTTHKTLRGPRGAMILCCQELAERIDKSVFPGMQGGPHNNTTAAIAVALAEASTNEFKLYAQHVRTNARVLAEELLARGFKLITGGTDNHLVLIDVMGSRGISGKVLSKALDKAGIVSNFNTIPFDTRKPFDPSGLRVGSPAVTSRGFGENEMKEIARWIDEVSRDYKNDAVLMRVKSEVDELCDRYATIPGFF